MHFDHFNIPLNKQIAFLFSSIACTKIPRNMFRVIKVASAWIHKTMDRTKYNRRNIRSSCPLRGRRQSRSYFALLRTVIPPRSLSEKEKKRSFLARGETGVMNRGNRLTVDSLASLLGCLFLSRLSDLVGICESPAGSNPDTTQLSRMVKGGWQVSGFLGHISLRKFQFSRCSCTLSIYSFRLS